MVTTMINCPSCGAPDLDLCSYESMMVLSEHIALFALTCRRCSDSITTVQEVPDQLLETVSIAAIEVGAGMGRDA